MCYKCVEDKEDKQKLSFNYWYSNCRSDDNLDPLCETKLKPGCYLWLLFPIEGPTPGMYYGQIVEPNKEVLDEGSYLIEFFDGHDPTMCEVEGGIYCIGEQKRASIIDESEESEMEFYGSDSDCSSESKSSRDD